MTLGYKVRCAGKTLVYATDSKQYKFTLEQVARRPDAGRRFGEQLDEQFVAFVSAADLYIGEAQYTDAEYPQKIGWGHSLLSATVEVALKAKMAALALFYHDPMHSDDVVAAMEREAQRLDAVRGATLRSSPREKDRPSKSEADETRQRGNAHGSRRRAPNRGHRSLYSI